MIQKRHRFCAPSGSLRYTPANKKASRSTPSEPRAWLLRRGAEGIAGLVLYSDRAGFVIFPRNMSNDGEWHERACNLVGPTHSLADVMSKLGGT